MFGRAVTNVLQNLRSVDDRFDAWYQPFRKEMESDPLMRYLYTLRSQILKEGALPTGMTICIRELQLPRDMARFGPPPPGAKGLFIGDSTGGSGWNVELPAGRIEKYYAEMPGDIGAVWVRLPEASLTSGSKYRIRGSRRFVNCTSSI